MNSHIKKLIFLAFIIVIALAVRFSSATDYLTFEHLKANREYLLTLVQAQYLICGALYTITYILVVALSLPVAAPLTLIGGFLFGVIGATLLANIGATIGATIVFFIVRNSLGSSIQEKYRTQLATFNANVEQYGTNYLLLARLVLFFPFFLVNILAGLTRIPITSFIWTTSLGIIPGTAVFAYAGKEIGTINALSDIFSWRVMITFGMLIALALISILVKKIFVKQK